MIIDLMNLSHWCILFVPPQGLCKLGSAGGTDYALRQFAEGSTEKLAKQCRKWVIFIVVFFFLLLFHTLQNTICSFPRRSCPHVALIYCCCLTADSAPRAHCTGTWSSSVPQAAVCSSACIHTSLFPSLTSRVGHQTWCLPLCRNGTA